MVVCSCCRKEIAPKVRFVRFTCPSCKKEKIYRCPRCRQISNPYVCPECGFSGP